MVVLHVPKTGGTSLRYALDPYAGEPSTPLPPKTVEVPADWKEQRHRLSQHATARQVERRYRGPWRFMAFYRNPWDWHMSIYRFIQGRKTHTLHGRFPSFEDYIRGLSDGRAAMYARSQTEWLRGVRGAVALPYEALQAGVDWICDEYSLPRVELPHHKAGVGPQTSRQEAYTPEMVGIVVTLCQPEIEQMGYSF